MPESESAPHRVPLVPESPLATAAGGAREPSGEHGSSPVPVLDPATIAALAEDLAQARWSVEHMDGILSTRARDALMRDQRVPALVELRELSEPAALLTRLFVLGSSEDADEVDAALPLTGTAGLAGLGLVRVENGLVTAAFDLRPHAALLPAPTTGSGTAQPDTAGGPATVATGGSPATADSSESPGSAEAPDTTDPEGVLHTWWVLSDLGEVTTGQPLRPDHVLGIGGATTSLLGLTIRDHVPSALDIGTGCGIQALYLATHADRVVATDLSERACAITRFNAALNGVDIDVRRGSLFEPVRGESFDLIVSNPPFVITPDSVRASGSGLLEYRDGGMERDNLIAEVISRAPSHLTPGGTLQMLANWEIPVGTDPDTGWSARVEDWLADLDVDAWVVQRDVLDPARYVEMWLRDSGGGLMDREEWETEYSAWLEDFDRAGVGAIGMGFVALRRPPSSLPVPPTPVHVFDEELGGRTPRGVDVARALGSLRLPAPLPDLRLRRAPDVTEERHYVPGEPQPHVIIEHQGAGLGRSVAVGSALAALVGAADGELTVSQIITAVAVLTDQEASDLLGQVEEPALELIRCGMLEVVGTL